MVRNLHTLRRPSLILIVGFVGICSASVVQASLETDLLDETEIEVPAVEPEDVWVDQPELAVLDDIVESIDEVTTIDAVDPVIELFEEEVILEEQPEDIFEPVDEVTVTDDVDPGIEEFEDVVILDDQALDAGDIGEVGSGTDVPIEWVLRDGDQAVMYTMAGAGGIDDAAEEIASRAAETAANRSLDQIDATLPDGAKPK